jgi:hypothetical protein
MQSVWSRLANAIFDGFWLSEFGRARRKGREVGRGRNLPGFGHVPNLL